jgi:SAM-dependent methyltransferase
MIITPAEFSRVTGECLSEEIKNLIVDMNLEFEELDQAEYNLAIAQIESTLKSDLKISGPNRKNDWVAGWSENLDVVDQESLVPKYMSKFPFVRWDNRLVKAKSKDFEYKMLILIQLCVFSKWLIKSSSIYEFGCGTGHNLFRARSVNKTANLYGLDWAESSQELLKKVNDKNILSCVGYNFDFFNPNYDITLDKNCSIYTFAALEQVGSNFNKFLDYIVVQKPEICVHIEPIVELMNEDNELDRYCAEYCKKRNYLDGYLTAIRALESKGQAEILEVKRNTIGSFYIEGYSQVVWRPIGTNK